jgi:hypothetical protein
MVKIIIVKSSRTPVPLAEIRTDGKNIDFVVDNTEGSLPEQCEGRYENLLKIVSHSSHLSLEQPEKSTVGYFRYILDTGDVVEITSDGKTAALNGKLLSDHERTMLFEAIKRKEIQVKKKADIEKPIPIFSFPKDRPTEPKKEKFDSEILESIKNYYDNLDKAKNKNSKEYDQELEDIAKKDAEDPEGCRQLLYALKYGD